jgi:hypothetical protein
MRWSGVPSAVRVRIRSRSTSGPTRTIAERSGRPIETTVPRRLAGAAGVLAVRQPQFRGCGERKEDRFCTTDFIHDFEAEAPAARPGLLSPPNLAAPRDSAPAGRRYHRPAASRSARPSPAPRPRRNPCRKRAGLRSARRRRPAASLSRNSDWKIYPATGFFRR